MKKSVPYQKVFAKFQPDMQHRVKARAKELIVGELALRDLRKSRSLTQEQVAERLGGKQVYVSRLESRADVKVSTLREYVHALGGELQLVVTFPGNVKANPRAEKMREAGKKSSGVST